MGEMGETKISCGCHQKDSLRCPGYQPIDLDILLGETTIPNQSPHTTPSSNSTDRYSLIKQFSDKLMKGDFAVASHIANHFVSLHSQDPIGSLMEWQLGVTKIQRRLKEIQRQPKKIQGQRDDKPSLLQSLSQEYETGFGTALGSLEIFLKLRGDKITSKEKEFALDEIKALRALEEMGRLGQQFVPPTHKNH